ncbi:MAG: hypothetical protein J7641_05855 [Cyanobacteria bacterium SID2]|nr:hypothetical protein [Cyanobacteria bacterium SID2]MBP0002889.1 hypothetical protein [Cyanobacteria bacterium SBC]
MRRSNLLVGRYLNAATALADLESLQREPERVTQLRSKSTQFLQLARERGRDTGDSQDFSIV